MTIKRGTKSLENKGLCLFQVLSFKPSNIYIFIFYRDNNILSPQRRRKGQNLALIQLYIIYSYYILYRILKQNRIYKHYRILRVQNYIIRKTYQKETKVRCKFGTKIGMEKAPIFGSEFWPIFCPPFCFSFPHVLTSCLQPCLKYTKT